MSTTTGEGQYRFEHYDITVLPKSDTCARIRVLDSSAKVEYDGEVALKHIRVSTLIMALERKSLEIKFDLNIVPDVGARIDVLVCSSFLKAITEEIMLEKKREVNETEILQNKLTRVKGLMEDMKEIETTLCNIPKDGEQDFSYDAGGSYMEIDGIKLNRGRYLLTISFFRKCKVGGSEVWGYLYLNNDFIIPSCESGFYVPVNQFIPHIITKQYHAKEDGQYVKITTNSNTSYPFIMKNLVISAQKLE